MKHDTIISRSRSAILDLGFLAMVITTVGCVVYAMSMGAVV